MAKNRSHDGNRKSHDHRLGNAYLVDLCEVDDEDRFSIHEQLAEFPDAAVGSDGVLNTGEQWEQYEENFERDEEDIQINDDEEVQAVIESESEALEAVSQANGTLTQAQQAHDDRCPRDQQRSQHVNRRGDVSCVVVLIWPVYERQEGQWPRQRSWCGVVTMATAFTAPVNPEVQYVRSVAKRRGFNASRDEFNPFDVYSPSEKF